MRIAGVLAAATALIMGLSVACGSGQPPSVTETPTPGPTPTPTVDRSLVNIIAQSTNTVVCGTSTESICIGGHCESKDVEVECPLWEAEIQNQSPEAISIRVRLNWNDSHGKTLVTERLSYSVEPGITQLTRTFYGQAGEYQGFIGPEEVASATGSLIW